MQGAGQRADAVSRCCFERSAPQCTFAAQMRFTEEHDQLRRTVRDFVEQEINPHVDEWERAGAFPAHELLAKAGKLGLLGVNKPEAYGGLGLDYSYQMCATEELGTCRAGAIPMALRGFHGR